MNDKILDNIGQPYDVKHILKKVDNVLVSNLATLFKENDNKYYITIKDYCSILNVKYDSSRFYMGYPFILYTTNSEDGHFQSFISLEGCKEYIDFSVYKKHRDEKIKIYNDFKAIVDELSNVLEEQSDNDIKEEKVENTKTTNEGIFKMFDEDMFVSEKESDQNEEPETVEVIEKTHAKETLKIIEKEQNIYQDIIEQVKIAEEKYNALQASLPTEKEIHRQALLETLLNIDTFINGAGVTPINVYNTLINAIRMQVKNDTTNKHNYQTLTNAFYDELDKVLKVNNIHLEHMKDKCRHVVLNLGKHNFAYTALVNVLRKEYGNINSLLYAIIDEFNLKPDCNLAIFYLKRYGLVIDYIPRDKGVITNEQKND